MSLIKPLFPKLRTKTKLLFQNMSTMSGVLSPPERVRGMTSLDKSLFNKTICVPFVEVEDRLMESAVKYLKPYLLKLKDFNPIEVKDNKRIVLLNPEMVSKISDFNTEDMKCNQKTDSFQIKDLKFKDIVITYDNYSHNAVLDSVLPSDEHSVSSFSIIGHIIHLNLRPHTLPYKQLIGQVLLDKNRSSDLIVNKLNTIDNEFRNFEMEVLAKRSEGVNTTVKIKEYFCDFEFDFGKVYWNPRLGTEHERIQLKLEKGSDVLYDVFAGVGPFAIPAAKRRKCDVFANDLNPECYKWLKHNCKLNKVEERVAVYNMDGRHFIRTVIREDLMNRIKTFDGIEGMRKYHIVMNLPALAIEFLDAFKGLLYSTDSSVSSSEYQIKPIIHCYCFVKDQQNGDQFVRQSVEEVFDYKLDNKTDIYETVFIRKVAPNKDMFRISFSLPLPVLYDEPLCHKRLKTE